MRTKKIFSTFFREKPAMMLVSLASANKEVYASSLAKDVDCTYSHVVKILQDFERAGIVSFKKEGRLKIIELTEKGRKVAEDIRDIVNAL